jgi:ribosomal protein S18 acetylase RimI-like enzyme
LAANLSLAICFFSGNTDKADGMSAVNEVRSDPVPNYTRLSVRQAMKNVLIRECNRQDLEGIFQLDKLWDEEGVAYIFDYGSREDFIADFERFQKYFLVAESEGQIIGYINGSVLVNDRVEVLPKQETYLEIENIYVRAEFRDRHVGGDLLEQLLGIAEQNGIKRFHVSTVTKDMDRILRFYRRYGFRPWSVELFK